MKRALIGLFFVAYVAASPFAAIPSLFLLWYAETMASRMFALAALCALALPFALLLFFRTRLNPKIRYGALAATSALPLLILIILFAIAPDGKPLPNSKVQSVFIGDGSYGRLAPSNIIPEIDQIKMAMMLSAYVDSRMTRESADRVVNAAMPIFRQIDSDPEYRALGSVMNYTYAEMYGGHFDVGHLYYYVPEHRPEEKLPVLLFLHGAAGSNKAYFWILQKLAEKQKCIVACPGFGFGLYRGPGAVAAIEGARAYTVEQLPGDPEQIYLIGLSNGGLGVSRAATAHPDHYAGLILLCSVLDRSKIHSAEFKTAWRGRSVLCICGVEDNRVPVDYLQEEMDLFSAAGLNVTMRAYEGEDHFFIFTVPERVCEDIAHWLPKRK